MQSITIKPSNMEKLIFWKKHVEQWKSSNRSQKTYCSQAGIIYNSFVYWRCQFLLESGESKPCQFVPVKLQPTAVALRKPKSMRIKSPSGYMIYIPDNISIEEVTTLVRLLEVSSYA